MNAYKNLAISGETQYTIDAKAFNYLCIKNNTSGNVVVAFASGKSSTDEDAWLIKSGEVEIVTIPNDATKAYINGTGNVQTYLASAQGECPFKSASAGGSGGSVTYTATLTEGKECGKLEIGEDVYSIYSKDYDSDISLMNSRLDTAISAVTTDTEVVDIRVGADGTTYATAGDAVRGQVDEIKGDLVDYTIDGYFALSGELSSRYFTKSGESTRANAVMKYTLPSDVKYIAIDMMMLAHIYYLAFTDANDNLLDVCNTIVGYSNKAIRDISIPDGATTLWLTNNSDNASKIKAYGKKESDYLYQKKAVDLYGFVKTDGNINDSTTWGRTRKIALDNVESITVCSSWSSFVATVAFYDELGTFISYVSANNQNDSAICGLLTIDKTTLPTNAKYFVASYRTDISYKSSVTVRYSKPNATVTRDLKYICFGDSITSDDTINSTGITGIGSQIANLLEANNIGNFAHGNATCSDYHTGYTSENIDTPNVDYGGTPSKPQANAKNVLSNQIKRALASATNSGASVTYKHPLDGNVTLDTSIWSGNGVSSNVPDIIYIAIGINDGNAHTLVADDTDTVFAQTYSQLDRCSFASSLRWAMETLISKFPDAQIFVASPLQTGSDLGILSFANTKLKRDIIEKVCQFESVHFIDSFSDSGFNRMLAKGNIASWDTDGVHPKQAWANNNARFIANEIKMRYTKRTH